MPWYVVAFELLVRVSLAGFVLLAATELALLAVRQPIRRVTIIRLALLGMLALPLLAMMPGYPRVALLPAEAVNERLPLDALAIDPVAIETPELAMAPVEQPPVAIPVKTNHDLATAPAPPIERALPTDFRLWVVMAYATGLTVMLGWSLVSLLALRRLVARAELADPATRAVLSELGGPAAERVRLLVSRRAVHPCAFGLLRPTIVLPHRLVQSGRSQELRFALAHEWAHIESRDLWTWSLAGAVRVLHFQQPLIWLLRLQLRESLDYLADAAASSGTPEDYAEFLTTISRATRRLAPGLGIVGRRSHLHRRVVMLIEQQGQVERTVSRRFGSAALAASLLTVLLVAMLHAGPRQATAAADDPPQPVDPAAPAEVAAPAAPATPAEAARPATAPAPVAKPAPVAAPAQPRVPGKPAASAPAAKPAQPNVKVYLDKLREIAANDAKVSGAIGARNRLMELLKTVEPAEQARYREVIAVLDEMIAQQRQHVELEGLDDLELLERLIEQTKGHLGGGRAIDARKPAAPFVGLIRPGDILEIEIQGGFPSAQMPKRTVEPEGTIALVAVYGTRRYQVAGKTLTEAGKMIEEKLRAILREPAVLVTYAGHDPDVAAAEPGSIPDPVEDESSQ